MIDQWATLLKGESGNYTTNDRMPENLISTLLEEDASLAEDLLEKDIDIVAVENPTNINGLEIIASLQRMRKKRHLTLFRAVRFPTWKRIHAAVVTEGYCVGNFEQERIHSLYSSDTYNEEREKIKGQPHFWTQPQERIVEGLPVFHLVNDALQIHRAFRGERDKVMIIAIHIPDRLLLEGEISLIANTAIDLNHDDTSRDFTIKDFIRTDEGLLTIDESSLRAQGIDLHEMYTVDLPMDIHASQKMGIQYNTYLLDIYQVDEGEDLLNLRKEVKFLKENRDFMHGFFGDHNIYGRRQTKYLPLTCKEIVKK